MPGKPTEPRLDHAARPERVGPYRLAEPIGRGGMGTVWRAWDERLRRQVAVKQIRADSRFAEMRQRLWREAQAAARLNHPSIVHIYDLVEDAAGDWIVMEFVEGKTLRGLTGEQGPLPFAQAVRLGLDIAEGLAEAHGHGILHRDLKAANVMVTPAGRAKILDFGLAKQIDRGEEPEDQEVSLSTPGLVLGTCYAMSPETRERRRRIGEQRLLTVVCCGMVGETGFLDLEDLPEAMADLQALAEEVCHRFSGRLGATLGHRLWIYFGYPQAREDDGGRAVLAARELAARRPTLRVAIHTGLAVVSIRPGEEEKLQPGPLLEVSAALQDLAPAGEILVSAASRPLIARGFHTEELPAVRLPGSAEPATIYRVLDSVDPLQDANDPLTPLVGRESELELLLDRFRSARAGTGQAVMIGGEPGIGKSRLLRNLRERLAPEGPDWQIAYGSQANQGSPLAPFIDLLERALFNAETQDHERRLDRLVEFLDTHGAPPAEIVPLVAPLLGIPFESRFPLPAGRLWVARLFEGEHQQALELAEEWLAGARRSGRGLLSAHGAVSHSLYYLGRLLDGLRHAETVLAFPPMGADEVLMDYGLPPRVGAAYYSAWALVHLGLERQALERHELAVELAEKHADPFGMAMALGASLTFQIRRHDLPAVLSTAERMKSQAVELGIPGEESLADRARSWALAESGDAAALHELLTGSLSRRQRGYRVNGRLERGWACHQIGVLLLRLGRLAEAGAVIEKGLAAARHGEHLVEPHLVCLLGELRLAQDLPEEAESTLRQAFELAGRGLQAPVAQRAAAALAPLLERQGRHAEAGELRDRLRELRAEAAERVERIFEDLWGESTASLDLRNVSIPHIEETRA